jgi:predicted O-linked N-acetylglucosamine transferase (SPINDLY family)
MNEPAPASAPAAIERLTRLIESGRPDLAAAEAASLRPRFPPDTEILRLQAIALLQLGRLAQARTALADAHALSPRSIEVLCNLGSVLLAEGDGAAAVETLERAFALAPDHPAVLNGLGNARRASGDLVGAREAYAGATQAAPDHVGAWFNLAAAELALGDTRTAERIARQALIRVPGHPDGLFILGHALAAQRRHGEAEAAYAMGERSAPRDARFAYHTGLMAEEQKHPAAAAEAHARALALDPLLDHALGQLVFLRRQLCDWHDLDALSARLRARVAAGAAGIAPFGFLAEPATAAEQRQCARNFADRLDAATAPLRAQRAYAPAARIHDGVLRVGFVANGFGDHPTTLLVVAFIEALRTQAVEIHLFSTAPDDGSPLLQRLRLAAHHWHDAATMSAPALADAIHGAAIDVSIDLDGYCSGALPAAFALRPAPLQVNWLAYPGTLGAAWIDYVIADRIVLPESLVAGFSEQVAWLPRCFQPSDPTRIVPCARSRIECGLPERGAVYACFNNSYKINPASFERMLAVLAAVPDAVLWLLCGPDGSDRRLRAEAGRRGIDPQRLVFAPKVAHAEYLARYAHADVFLDTAPYGAHTTASDAVWAGCPVLTVPGATFASRVAASINHHLGMPQLNLPDDTAFVQTAVRLGHQTGAFAALRSELARRRADSGLFDMQAYAVDFAALLQRMAERHRAGLAPARLALQAKD